MRDQSNFINFNNFTSLLLKCQRTTLWVPNIDWLNNNIPADTLCKNDVVVTSKRCHFFKMASCWLNNDVIIASCVQGDMSQTRGKPRDGEMDGRFGIKSTRRYQATNNQPANLKVIIHHPTQSRVIHTTLQTVLEKGRAINNPLFFVSRGNTLSMIWTSLLTHNQCQYSPRVHLEDQPWTLQTDQVCPRFVAGRVQSETEHIQSPLTPWCNWRKHENVSAFSSVLDNGTSQIVEIHFNDREQALHWRHNERDGVSNHQPHDCLLNRLFRRRSK